MLLTVCWKKTIWSFGSEHVIGRETSVHHAVIPFFLLIYARTHLFTHPEGWAGPGNSIERKADRVGGFCSGLTFSFKQLPQQQQRVIKHSNQPHLHQAAVTHQSLRSCPISYEGGGGNTYSFPCIP